MQQNKLCPILMCAP